MPDGTVSPSVFPPPPQTQEGQSVGFETEAYAIMDTLRYIRPDVHTVCCGKAFGNAAMLLASGKKGNRYSLPHASIMTCPPRLNRKVDTATNLMITANELDSNTETYVEYLVEFTGKTRDEVLKDIARTRYFTPETAIEYGLIDKVINPKSVRKRAAASARWAGGALCLGTGRRTCLVLTRQLRSACAGRHDGKEELRGDAAGGDRPQQRGQAGARCGWARTRRRLNCCFRRVGAAQQAKRGIGRCIAVGCQQVARCER